jgi:hypothetical protein
MAEAALSIVRKSGDRENPRIVADRAAIFRHVRYDRRVAKFIFDHECECALTEMNDPERARI